MAESTTKEKEPKKIDADQVLRDLQKLEELLSHIQKVQEGALRIGKHLIRNGESELGRTLIANSLVHDQSKFRGIEWDMISTVDSDLDKEIRMLAVSQHNRTNKHHPEYWSSIHEMPEIYIAEMVCDWYARSSEFGTDLREWVKESATKRFNFTTQQKVWKIIKKYIDIVLEKPFS